jgi:hypothetical protein
MVRETTLLIVAAVLACAAGCGSGLDTSWHVEQKPLPENHPSKGLLETGEHSWRFIEPAKAGDTLPGGAEATQYDVLWEWRLEVTNVSNEPRRLKAGFSLVTADDTVRLSSSQDPPEEKALAVIQPGEKKVFTGQGFIDKTDIPRVARGRGMLGEPSGKKP